MAFTFYMYIHRQESQPRKGNAMNEKNYTRIIIFVRTICFALTAFRWSGILLFAIIRLPLSRHCAGIHMVIVRCYLLSSIMNYTLLNGAA